MNLSLTIGLIAEGNTDKDFLPSIISRVYITLLETAEVFVSLTPIQVIELSRTDLPDYILSGAREAYISYGVDILCVHHDADDRSDKALRAGKLAQALQRVASAPGDLVRIIVPIVPVRTLENWMLADRQALKNNINTKLSDRTLGIHHHPESYPKPKDTIKAAIRRQAKEKPGRRRQITIGDLYIPLGEEASLEELLKLPSFQKFYAAARQSLIDLGLIVPE